METTMGNYIKLRLLVRFVLVAFTVAFASSAVAIESEQLCWRDYPIPTDAVNYEEAFASGTLAPESITINTKVLRLGMTESDLRQIVGLNSTEAEDWQERTAQQQCEYLLEILRKHPNSMHLYILGGLKLKRMSGLFRVSEWQLPRIGQLLVFFYKPYQTSVETAYLFHLTLLLATSGSVKHEKVEILKKVGTPQITWDIATNRILINDRNSSSFGTKRR
jgi:hypothetical protein